MCVPVQSQEPVIQWLSFVYVLHICFLFIFFFTSIRPLVFSFELFYIVLSGPFIADYVTCINCILLYFSVIFFFYFNLLSSSSLSYLFMCFNVNFASWNEHSLVTTKKYPKTARSRRRPYFIYHISLITNFIYALHILYLF